MSCEELDSSDKDSDVDDGDDEHDEDDEDDGTLFRLRLDWYRLDEDLRRRLSLRFSFAIV